ncbi:flagellar motor protein MotB [Granulicella cerasi]|uniref:Flagellar motor protein MotB n=1 Tax=Granulicella cerasi TaxID=741063 RepID=A0ABW1ZD15_9BACT|nr:flagellar motor protein MotB [Granulicella cerasi]
MSKKKHPEHVNHERWLVSYADFITLLFAFFVVLFASGQADKKKQQKFASAFQQAFAQMALFDSHSSSPAMNPGSGANPQATPKPIELPLATSGQEVEKKITRIVHEQDANGAGVKVGELSVRSVQEGVALSLHEGGFFPSGSAELRPEATSALQRIAEQIPDAEIRVEGHTDNLPIHSAIYASNWELSSARAAAIAHFLLLHSTLQASHVSVAGYAEYRPVASNATPEGRAANRRVDIVFLTKPHVAATSTQAATSN